VYEGAYVDNNESVISKKFSSEVGSKFPVAGRSSFLGANNQPGPGS
jgi:hypothetical protein